eukprot:CAMPEP_0206221858 /NCGR_PEP_ID=MMETSP0047_2-20121206/5645_1 /ASSEMBLY_ACC=CAM_ASM_000192 /TAXON_ID=195065 /ORGANISM="Chroomonas mesostigmatica_cf, Strain CCMP1168" /LENGTH=38 /DNA_ID= /DNA_START= /DNA_END= /DNA_ORIENTATION=
MTTATHQAEQPRVAGGGALHPPPARGHAAVHHDVLPPP